MGDVNLWRAVGTEKGIGSWQLLDRWWGGFELTEDL
jgi:hypothetical protein